MSMLHIVNKSPFERDALTSCLDTVREDDSVLLIEDGVVCATSSGRFADRITQAMACHTEFYALNPDLKARGLHIHRVLDGIKLIDYEAFVDLVAEHSTVQSWL